MGLEEVTSYFHYGLAESAGRNPVSAQGYATCRQFALAQPVTVNYIMAVTKVPAGFDRVVAIKPTRVRDAVRLRSVSGQSVSLPVDVGFLYRTGEQR
jgi:hypothetical protein